MLFMFIVYSPYKIGFLPGRTPAADLEVVRAGYSDLAHCHSAFSDNSNGLFPLPAAERVRMTKDFARLTATGSFRYCT
jgi:hypothetical protein